MGQARCGIDEGQEELSQLEGSTFIGEKFVVDIETKVLSEANHDFFT